MIPGLTIFPFRANWSSPITLHSTFATNTGRESIPGDRTRDSGRDFGQRQIMFSILPDSDAGVPLANLNSRRSWDAFRETNPPGAILGVPLWSEEGVQLTADAAIGATTLHVTNADFIDWRTEAVMWKFDDSSFEGIQIASISGYTITLSAPLSGAFNSGTQVLPLMRGFQLDDYAEEVISPETSQLVLTFVEDLAAANAPVISGLASALTYLGTPVIPVVAEWSESPSISIGQGTHHVAQGLNRAALATLRSHVHQHISLRLGLDGRQDRATLWKFFHDRRGRWQRFWLPSLKNELKLSADVGATDTSLQLENFAQFSQRFSLGGNLRRAIFITSGDRFWCRQVSNLSGGTNRVSIDSAIGQALGHSSTSVGLLSVVQFATDDIEIECDTPLIATATLTFAELEHEYTEVITAGTLDGAFDGMELTAP